MQMVRWVQGGPSWWVRRLRSSRPAPDVEMGHELVSKPWV